MPGSARRGGLCGSRRGVAGGTSAGLGKTYLGDRFLPYYDSSRGLASDWDTAAPTTPAQVRTFFENNTGYLYNLTIWEASGNRPHYLEAAAAALPPRTRILDHGCGIGSDTIALRERGHRVIPCDLPSPHAAFATWRLGRRGHPTFVIDPATAHGGDFETLWITDTLDHLPDLALLDPVLSSARLVVTENLGTSRGHGRQRFHHRRTFDQIRAAFQRHHLHRDLGRSHAGPAQVSPSGRARRLRAGCDVRCHRGHRHSAVPEAARPDRSPRPDRHRLRELRDALAAG